MEHFADSDTLRNNLQSRLTEQGLFNTSENSIVRNMMEAMLIPVDELNAIAEDIQRDMFATTAAGQALDKHGQLIGVTRNTGTLPYGSILVYITDGKTASQITTDGAGIYIPRGTRIIGADYPFVTVEEGYLAPEATDVRIRVIGTQIITDPIPPDTLRLLDLEYGTDITNIDDISRNGSEVVCTNNEDIITGAYQESDSDYRNRMYYSAKAYHDRMEDTIRKILYDIPEIADIKFVKNVYGIGTTAVVITTRNPITDDGIITYANAKLEEVASDSIKAMLPDYLAVTIYNKVSFSNDLDDTTMASIEEQISILQKSYVNNLMPGATLSIESIQNIAKNSNSNVSNVLVTCLKINNRPVTLENQMSGWDEKFITIDTQSSPAIIFV